ncbi:MAG TPA: hypothetical protein VLJ86_04755 [Ramlibacter sp.]|nr:hypothetical protein [Ramlibacter sp.]
MTPSDSTLPTATATPSRAQARRLREIYRSAGWPCQDPLELELLACGLIERQRDAHGRETLRLTQEGIALVARQMAVNRAALSQHEALVKRVAQEMARAGRIAWCGLGLRAQVATDVPGVMQWCVARPDVFSIRNTSVAEYVEPIVHEIKVRRADLLGDLRKSAKRESYLHLGECWYVLGQDAKGRAIAEPDEIPAECGVLIVEGERLQVARPAIRRARSGLPFGVWMALAKAAPAHCVADEDAQALLGDVAGPGPDSAGA